MQFGPDLMQRSRAARMTIAAAVLLGWLAGVPSLSASDKDAAFKTVDSGAFGVFIGGRRVATETFSIHQGDTGSEIVSEFKTDGPDKADQTSTLDLGTNGDLQKYSWKEINPGQSVATVLPSDNFLVEKFANTPQEKMHEQPFLMPASTNILDDYFFVHREVLAWRYLATSCKQDKGQIQCPFKQKTQMGALNPHGRSSLLVNVAFGGREKVTIRGADHELIRLDMTSDSGDWTVWLDDQLKMQKIVIATDGSEVIRD
jgi:hypothetical protein